MIGGRQRNVSSFFVSFWGVAGITPLHGGMMTRPAAAGEPLVAFVMEWDPGKRCIFKSNKHVLRLSYLGTGNSSQLLGAPVLFLMTVPARGRNVIFQVTRYARCVSSASIG